MPASSQAAPSSKGSGSHHRRRRTICRASWTPSSPRWVKGRASTPSGIKRCFRTGDLLAETRWPQFSRRAHDETGVTSILAVRLFAEHETMGALNLYSTQPDAFDDTDVAFAAVFATHAAVAM